MPAIDDAETIARTYERQRKWRMPFNVRPATPAPNRGADLRFTAAGFADRDARSVGPRLSQSPCLSGPRRQALLRGDGVVLSNCILL